MEELARDLRVKFTAPSQVAKEKPSRHQSDSTEALRKAMAAGSLGPKQKKATKVPAIWFGMAQGGSGLRWITQNPSEANTAAATGSSSIAQLFHAQDEAEAWISGPLEEDSDDDPDDELPPALIPREHSDSEDESIVPISRTTKSGRGLARRQEKKRAQKARQRQNVKDSKARTASGPNRKSRTHRPSTHGGRKNPRRQSGRRSSKKRDSSSDPSSSEDSDSSSHGSDSDSSTSSSEPSGYSSSSSSDSSSQNHRTSSRKDKKKKKKKSKRKSKPSPKANFHKYQNHDPSTGDPKKAFGMSINGTKIDKAVCPDKMRRDDQASMYTAAVDVTSLPGGWNTNKGASEELYAETRQLAQLTSTILASTGKAKGMEINDTTWNTITRHSLGRIKDRTSLFEFVKKLRKSHDAAFNQQSNLVQHFLSKRHYTEAYSEEYCRSGLLSRITSLSYTYFFALAETIRQSAHDYPSWEGGPAHAMLTVHSDKLVEIRQFAVSRKQLILQVYTYLRDSHAKSFYHESMSNALWERIGSLNGPLTGFYNDGGASDDTKCGLCSNKDFHKLLQSPGQKHLCPLKPLVDKAKCREAARWILDQKRTSSTADVPALLASALVQFV